MSSSPFVVPRVFARFDQGEGPLIMVVCGIHGNEPAGVVAARRVMTWLQEQRPDFEGTFVALAGNVGALRHGTRYLRGDLNRRWRAEDVAALRRRSHTWTDDPEDHEQRELLAVFDEILAEASGPVLVLDLHSFSGFGAPFVVTHDAVSDIILAEAVELPTIVGLDDFIRGTLLEYFTGIGCPIIGVEAGQHYDPRTIAFHEAAILLSMVLFGAIDAADIPDYRRIAVAVRRAAVGLPELVDVVYCHHIDRDDGFVMRPGFRNLMPVFRGQHLADDKRGPIVAPIEGWLLMPLYQGQGAEGFFIALER